MAAVRHATAKWQCRCAALPPVSPGMCLSQTRRCVLSPHSPRSPIDRWRGMPGEGQSRAGQRQDPPEGALGPASPPGLASLLAFQKKRETVSFMRLGLTDENSTRKSVVITYPPRKAPASPTDKLAHPHSCPPPLARVSFAMASKDKTSGDRLIASWVCQHTRRRDGPQNPPSRPRR